MYIPSNLLPVLFLRGFHEVFRARFMGAVVSMTRQIMIATTDVSVSSRFTSGKGNELVTYIQNRDSHYEFLETHAEERYSEMSKANALFGDWNDNPCLQVKNKIVALYTPSIIGNYEATKNHLIAHVLANTISGRSGASIVQVAKNPSETSRRNWDSHVSYMTKNDLLGYMPFWSTLIFDKKKLIWDGCDCCGIKLPSPSGGCGPVRGGRGSHGGRGGQNRAGRGSAKGREITDLKKQLAKKSARSINDVIERKEYDIDVST